MQQTSAETFSGRFQIRIPPETHKDLSEYARGFNASMSDVIEQALVFSFKNPKFLEYADDYFHGMISVIEDGMPKATLVRRNLESYKRDGDKLKINIRVKQGSVWKKWSFSADLKQNPNLLNRLDSWKAQVLD